MSRDAEKKAASSTPGRAAPSANAKAAAILLALGLSACAGSVPNAAPPPPSQPQAAIPTAPAAPTVPQRVARPGLTPSFAAGRPLTRVGVLLPFTSVTTEAQSLYEAAELALFEANDPNLLIIPRDSGGDAPTALTAAQGVLKDGADVIVGPLIKESVQGAAQAAASAQPKAPIIAFSTDNTVAGNGVFLLSLPLDEEIARIVDYASKQGLKRLALLAPNNEYGRRVDAAVRKQAAAHGASVVASQFYTRSEKEAGGAAQLMAPQAKAFDAQAVLIAETGAPLRAIGSALASSGLDLQHTRLLGVGWAAGDALREPTLAGGWYAAPDPAARAAFEQKFTAAYGKAPTRLASLAYDAVTVTELLTRETGAAGLTALQRPEGFTGADGLFRFRADGTVERALAVLEVRANTAAVIDPAPARFPAAGF
ncbi:MAG: penicillin-binding protein activator [Alphaproteobacteria bacterium]